MSQYIEKFDVLKNSENLEKQKIKSFFIFNNISDKHPYNIDGKNVFIIDKNDDVFAFGSNTLGCLGLGHNRKIEEPEKIRELCGKNIIDIKNGLYHVIARNEFEDIFCMGYNNFGQLGNGKKEKKYSGAEINSNLNDKNIVEICCGDWHSLALTHARDLYAWGDNQFGQIGIGSQELCIPAPVKLNSFGSKKIGAFSCGSMHSMALTKDGEVYEVYTWGLNKYGQLGIGNTKNANKPQRINIEKLRIDRISCGQKHSLLLCLDGYIYFFGKTYLESGNKNQLVPKKLNNPNKFIDIISHKAYQFSVAVSKIPQNISKSVCYEFGIIDSKKVKHPQKTDLETFIEYYATKCNITLKIIHEQPVNVEQTSAEIFSNVNQPNYSNISAANLEDSNVQTNIAGNSYTSDSPAHSIQNENHSPRGSTDNAILSNISLNEVIADGPNSISVGEESTTVNQNENSDLDENFDADQNPNSVIMRDQSPVINQNQNLDAIHNDMVDMNHNQNSVIERNQSQTEEQNLNLGMFKNFLKIFNYRKMKDNNIKI
jgi:alpha-tubulin suppressor-like RCC1 family protein